MKDRRWIVAGWTLGVLMTLTGCGAKDKGGESAPAANQASSADAKAALASAVVPGIPKAGQPAGDPLHPTVLIETSLGKIVVKLNAEKAGLTVQNFLSYVDRRHYDGTIFHQVFKNYVVLGGGYTPELTEKPTATPVRNEAHNGPWRVSPT